MPKKEITPGPMEEKPYAPKEYNDALKLLKGMLADDELTAAEMGKFEKIFKPGDKKTDIEDGEAMKALDVMYDFHRSKVRKNLSPSVDGDGISFSMHSQITGLLSNVKTGLIKKDFSDGELTRSLQEALNFAQAARAREEAIKIPVLPALPNTVPPFAPGMIDPGKGLKALPPGFKAPPAPDSGPQLEMIPPPSPAPKRIRPPIDDHFKPMIAHAPMENADHSLITAGGIPALKGIRSKA